MKFYYNGTLMRTSKTRQYKYAVISASGKCLACSETYNGALKYVQYYVNIWRKNIAYLESLVNGKRKVAQEDIDLCYGGNIEIVKEKIKLNNLFIEQIRVVELQARA